MFSSGKDGGRDAIFSGTATKFPSPASPLAGRFLIQAKHTSNPAGSCSDRDFERLLEKEALKVKKLIADGEVEHYLVFTNRRKPAIKSSVKEKELKALGLKSASILGSDQLRDWLTHHPEIWSNLGYDRFERPFRIQVEDLTEVIASFHQEMKNGGMASPSDFTYVPKPEKNRINKLSSKYFDEIQTRSLPYFSDIEAFLKNPRNLSFKEMYEDTADEIRRKLIAVLPPFESFDLALTAIIDFVTEGNAQLKKRRRFAAIFLHYMYYTCDIGQHAEAEQTS